MTKNSIMHALGLHMHQPPGNLRLLIEENEWEAQQIIRCYERAARYAHQYRDIGSLNIGFSGVLLEQFRDPNIIDRYRQFIDIPAMLELYRSAENIELIGMGYFHPIFPLIPQEDWQDQLISGRQIMADMFGREPRGFWPPEMAFAMEMIPALVKAGYEYVIVDSVHVKALDRKEVTDIYQPYVARMGDEEITIVPRDRDISNAQESGMDAGWFINEVMQKIDASPNRKQPRLITTWSDGENGGWFRQMTEEAGFFGHFFTPFMNQIRTGQTQIIPTKLSDYLAHNPPEIKAHVQTGAWNVANTSGYDFSQWAGSDSQRAALEKIFDVSRRYWELHKKMSPADDAHRVLDTARSLILESETSCFLFWGDDWVPKLYERIDKVDGLLKRVEFLSV